MSITTNDDWQWQGSGYGTAFATTDDPRVVAVIERDDDATIERCLDGDAIPSVYSIEYLGEYRAYHQGGFQDDDFAQRLTEARSRFQYAAGYRYDGLSYDMIAKARTMMQRWARIFHRSAFTIFHHRGDEWLAFTSDTFCEHVGCEEFDPAHEEKAVEAIVTEVESILDGDVYGIGFATNEGRVLGDDEDIDLDDANWVTAIDSWGYVGEDYAKQTAALFEMGEPDMEPMLELPTLHEPDHTDRLAELSISAATEKN